MPEVIFDKPLPPNASIADQLRHAQERIVCLERDAVDLELRRIRDSRDSWRAAFWWSLIVGIAAVVSIASAGHL